MQKGARICPRCATRVDERAARGSLYCLRCGAPLGTPPPMSYGTTAAAKSGSPLPWILGAIGLVAVLGTCGVGVLVVAASSSDSPKRKGTGGSSGLPNLETTGAPTPITPPTPPTAPTVKPQPTFTATTPRPTVTPTVVPPPTRTTPTATPDDPPFPAARANAELDRVIAGLQSCKFPSDTPGSGTIEVQFEPDGRTGTVRRAPFNNNATGSCISSRFLSIRLGRFEGPRRTFVRSFTIR